MAGENQHNTKTRNKLHHAIQITNRTRRYFHEIMQTSKRRIHDRKYIMASWIRI